MKNRFLLPGLAVLIGGFILFFNKQSDTENLPIPSLRQKAAKVKVSQSDPHAQSPAEPLVTIEETEKNIPEESMKAMTPAEERLIVVQSALLVHSKHREAYFEAKLEDMFKRHNKSHLFEEYKNLKAERNRLLRDHLKKDGSQRGLHEFNISYHNRLYEKIGADLYKEYLVFLKHTNDFKEESGPSIVLSF